MFAWQLALNAIAKFIGWLILLSTLFGLAASAVRGSETPSTRAPAKLTREYDLKAAFLFNFSQFVAWPDQAFAKTNSPFVIVVLGDDPFGKTLDQIVANEEVRGHRIIVKRCHEVSQITDCHILYISPSETARLDRIFGFLDGRSILTVGEVEGFASHGGAVRFLRQENKVRLKINVEAAKSASLTMSSKLLRQAEILEPGRDQPAK